MKKTVDAIKYGLETLNITPKELFSLIESSKGYTGSDYSRWLANEIICIAEKDEVLYSQLLAKWFNIIQSIIEEHVDESISEEFTKRVQGLCANGGKVYTVGIAGEENPYGTPIDIDWVSLLDLPFNYEFIESLPEGIGESIINGEKITFLFRLGSISEKYSGSPLVSDAKSVGIVVKSYDALLLYRICSMIRALGDEAGNLSFVLIGNTDFFYNPENADLIKYFLSYARYEGFAVDSKDLYDVSYTNESYAIIKCAAFTEDNEGRQDGVVLPKLVKGGEAAGVYRYSCGSDIWRTLVGEYGIEANIDGYTIEVSTISEVGNKVSTQRGSEEAIGYLCNSTHLANPVVATLPLAGSESIAITTKNFYRCVAYYGVVTALRGQGFSSDIPDIISGHPEYINLVANCLPLVLFGKGNLWGDIADEKLGDFKEFILKEIETLSAYYSYEAKELMDLGKKLWNGSEWGTKFGDVLTHSDSDRQYLNAISRCQAYVCSLYRLIG